MAQLATAQTFGDEDLRRRMLALQQPALTPTPQVQQQTGTRKVDIEDPAFRRFLREQLVARGHNPKKVDEALSKRLELQQREELVRQGVVGVEELAKESPGAALKLSREGFTPKPKEQEKIESAVKVIDVLESLYLGKEGEKTLAFGEAGLGGRVPGLAKEIQRKIAPETFPESTRLNSYKRTLESKRSMLAKAAGDAGNIAIQEQLLAGKGLPDEKSTINEAVSLFRTMREAFGVEPSGLLQQFEQERLPKIEKEKGGGFGDMAVGIGKGIFNFMLGNVKSVEQDIVAGVTTNKVLEKQRQTHEGAVKLMDMALEEQDPKQKLILLAQSQILFQQLGEQQKSLISKFSKDVEGGAVSRGIGAGAEIATTAAAITGLPSILRKTPELARGAGKKVTGIFKPKVTPPTVTKPDLLKGLEVAEKGSKLRNKVIEKAQKAGKTVKGTKIIEAIQKWGDEAIDAAPGRKAEITKWVKGTVKRYTQESGLLSSTGKKIVKPRSLSANEGFKLWENARKGYSAAGKTGQTLEAGFHRTVRDILRKELDNIAPGFEKGTKLIKKGLTGEKLLKPVREGLEKKEVREGLKETIEPSKAGEAVKSIARKARDIGLGVGIYKILFGGRGGGGYYE